MTSALEELRQGLLGADYAGGDYLSPTYIENLQQDLVLRDVLVDFNQIELEEKIGEGAFGDVWKANFRGAQVAVKMIKTHMFMDISDDDMEQIRKEAYLMSRLRHPNIVLIMVSDEWFWITLLVSMRNNFILHEMTGHQFPDPNCHHSQRHR